MLVPEITQKNIFYDEFWVTQNWRGYCQSVVHSWCAESHALLQTCFSAQKKVKTTLPAPGLQKESRRGETQLGLVDCVVFQDTSSPATSTCANGHTQESEVKIILVHYDPLSSHSLIFFEDKQHELSGESPTRIKREVFGFLKSISWGLWTKWSFPNAA